MPADRDTLIALHEQLAALCEAGAAAEIGMPRSMAPELRGWVDRLGDRPLDPSIADEALTPGHGRLLREWLSGGELGALLGSLSASRTIATRAERRLFWGLAYPVLIAAAACAGLVAMSGLLTPVFETQYADLRIAPSPGVRWLRLAWDWAPFWAPAVALGLGLIVVGLRAWRWPRGEARAELGQALHDAASLCDAGLPVAEAMQVASVSPRRGRSKPLVRWAESAANGSQLGALGLRAIGDGYLHRARARAERFAALAPLVCFVLLGGGAVLIYALALFLPVIELLGVLPG